MTTIAGTGDSSPTQNRAPEARSETPWAAVVDDDATMRRLAARILERVGYVVVTAETAEEGMGLLAGRRGRVRVLVSDIELPGLSGSQLVAQARAEWPELATVLMSGASAGHLAARGLIPAGTRVLEKPFVPTDLLEHVDSALKAAALSRP